MSDYKDYGQQFKTELEYALDSGDFHNLNRLVQDTVQASVSGVADQVQRTSAQVKDMAGQVRKAYDQAGGAAYAQKIQSRHIPNRPMKASERHGGVYGRTSEKAGDSTEESGNRSGTLNQAAGDKTGMASEYRADTGTGLKPVKPSGLFKKTGSVASVLYQVFGGIGIGIFGIAMLIFLILFFFIHAKGILALVILFLLMAAGSGFLLGMGGRTKARMNRSQRYFELGNKTGYVNISTLAEAVGKSDSFVVKELKALIAGGAFPQGHLDKQQQCFMLSDAHYEEYQRVTRERESFELEQGIQPPRLEAKDEKSAKGRNQADAASHKELTEEQKQLRAIIIEGQDYIRRIREKNDAIPGEVFSQKLYRMESILKEIFANLEKMPEQMPKMRKLMNYYLPTTLKLVDAYEQFEHAGVKGQDVVSAQKEIENTVDTINDAFEELLNKLFASAAMDVTADAQVLKTMLAQEGLSKGGLEYVNEFR